MDQAVGFLGRAIEAELSKVESKNEAEAEQKKIRILNRFLYDEEEKPSHGSFADPAAMTT